MPVTPNHAGTVLKKEQKASREPTKACGTKFAQAVSGDNVQFACELRAFTSCSWHEQLKHSSDQAGRPQLPNAERA
jgi:hypothetical protein